MQIPLLLRERLHPSVDAYLILQEELRKMRWKLSVRRRRVGLLKHRVLMQLLLQRLLVLLQRRSERLDILRRQCPESVLHQQLLADQLSG
jgi:hypothetical protein